MSDRSTIKLASAKPLTTRQERGVVAAAFDRRPSPVLRAMLARLMRQMKDDDRLIALLQPHDDLSAGEALLLASAWLDRSAPDGYAQAGAAIDRALAQGDLKERSAALALRAKIENRSHDPDAARATLDEALALDPHNREACMRLIGIAVNAHDIAAIDALADRLTSRGVTHPYVFAARTLALARRGQIDAARRLVGTDRFAHVGMLAPPAGWTDIAAFNAALAIELCAHPDLRRQRYGSAPMESWAIDAPLTRDTPLLALLLGRIAEAFEERIANVAATDHDWARARPPVVSIDVSCIITEADDFEAWHVHPTGWLNGVYYVQVPPAVEDGTGDAGCIGLGLPDDLAGGEAAAAYGVETVRPRSGMLLTFPSHTYHRTFPHGCDTRRICITIEAQPA